MEDRINGIERKLGTQFCHKLKNLTTYIYIYINYQSRRNRKILFLEFGIL